MGCQLSPLPFGMCLEIRPSLFTLGRQPPFLNARGHLFADTYPSLLLLCGATGVQDENSSRGKMVQSYLKQADAVWLVHVCLCVFVCVRCVCRCRCCLYQEHILGKQACPACVCASALVHFRTPNPPSCSVQVSNIRRAVNDKSTKVRSLIT